MKFARLAVGACLGLAVAGCADHTEVPQGASAPSAVAEQGPEAPAREPVSGFGTQRVWSGGMAVTVSQPTSLKPSDTSFPKAPRTAVFTLTLVNDTEEVYRTSLLAVRAEIAGAPVAEVRDSVQGLNGVGTAVSEVPPGGETVLTMAFAVPEHPVRLRLVIEPNGAGQQPSATFEGQT